MQAIFDELIDSFMDGRVGIAEHFISDLLAGHLRDHLTRLFEDRRLLTGGTGNESRMMIDRSTRSDSIYWLDRTHDNPWENKFLTLIDDFVGYLNRTCYTGITGYEFHYSVYESGAFYRKHLDQFRNDRSRQYSLIIYLNSQWKEADGGQLMIHHPGREYTISPAGGKGVFFKSSELEHEVLTTTVARMSITGWLKKS